MNHRIQKFNNYGQWIAGWGGQGTDNGQFFIPNGVDVDVNGNVYVADTYNDRVQKFSNNGQWLTSWSDIDSFPKALDVDSYGNIFIVDLNGFRIQKFNTNGDWLTSWGTEGDGAGNFDGTEDIFVDSLGIVYTADRNNSIKIFRLMTYTRPIATITHASATSLGQNDTLTLRGLGQDSDETPAIAAYRWTSDRDGVLGTSATLTRSATSLSPGTHRITLQVQDGEGEWSDPVSTTIYVASPPQAEWTMLLYLSGDYHDRHKQLGEFTQAIEGLGQHFRNPYVRIAIQLDGPADGDTRRLLITPGSATTAPNIDEQAYAEQAMDEPQVLADFVRWGQASFPAAHYYLAIADHGQAIQGIGWDTTSDLRDNVQDDGAYLTVKELGQALTEPGVAPVDILHLDACSMNLLEVAYEVRQQAKVLIASQYLGWNYFAYDEYPSAIGDATDRYAVARGITGMYAARARADKVPFTIAALDLQRAEPAVTAVDQLAAELAALVNNDQSNRTVLDEIWRDSRKFESNGDYLNDDLDMYVDLLDWATKVQVRISSPAVKARAAALIAELTGPQPFIIADSNHAQSGALPLQYANGAYIDLTRSNGLSIFYPQDAKTIAFDSYINNRLFSFTSASRWPDFLIAGLGPQSRGDLKPLPGPLEPLSNNWQAFLPFVLH